MSIDDDYDYWTQEFRAPTLVSQPAPTVDTIAGVEPLDGQFGVAEPLTVPTVLQDVLFGQLEPAEAEIAAHGGNPTCVPLLHTYAILDAAKVINLPEMLETSGLEHRCLFKGDAFDELKNVAPWIVRLEDNNSFTRNLFTRSDAPWHLWDNEPGVYLRSRGTLDEMWRHLRKFTKVQDEKGKWFYLAFWRGYVLSAFSQEECLRSLMDEFSRPLCSMHWFAMGASDGHTFFTNRFALKE